ncbi:hypothetical protein ACFXAE_35065 [Streptomyces sp. NPDC059454]|jgi:hypothetical protein|uniref:hypothetical protein n=1 Tax=Streptomyces sp. NPDC059454 TaxID=3346836 RepID=UPI003679D421
MRVRPAAPGELPALQDLERVAGAPFRDVGMRDIADDEPPAPDVLERYQVNPLGICVRRGLPVWLYEVTTAFMPWLPLIWTGRRMSS